MYVRGRLARGPGLDPREGHKVLLGVLLGISVVARSLEVRGVTPLCLGKHVNL